MIFRPIFNKITKLALQQSKDDRPIDYM